MIRLRSALSRLISMIAETVDAVEPVGGDQLSQQRPLGSRIHRHVRAAEFRGVQSIAGGLRDGNIAGNDGDGATRTSLERRAMISATASSEAVAVSMRSVRVIWVAPQSRSRMVNLRCPV